MKNYNNLILDIENDFYLIKINRPKFLNALNQETIHELRTCFEYINSNTKNKYGVMHMMSKINAILVIQLELWKLGLLVKIKDGD